MRTRSPVALQVALASLLSLTACVPAPRDPATGDETPAALRIEVSYASGVHEGPLTGRLFLALSPTAEPEPRIGAYHSAWQRDGRVLGEPYARVITGDSTGRIRGRSARTGDPPSQGSGGSSIWGRVSRCGHTGTRTFGRRPMETHMRRLAGAATLVGVVVVVLVAHTGARGFGQEPVRAADGRQVTQADVERWKRELTNWGRWGGDDEIGTLNLITSEKRRQAADLVREGRSVSLAHDAETEATIDGPRPYQVIPLGITADEIRVAYHGFIHTHLDFLNHNFIGDGITYNNYQPDPEVVAAQGGHARNTVHNAKSGIVTRGILIDMARFRNVPYLEPGTPIYIEDLEAWEAATGVTVSSGDAVVIRTGRWARRADVGPWDVANEAAGLHASVIPWLKQRDIALLGGEAAQDMAPADADPAVTVPEDLGPRPLHRFVLIYLGMPLFDNLDLEAVAEVAASLNRYEFLLTAAPLPTRGTGSPINPIATF